MKYGKLSLIGFYSSYLQQCLPIELFSHWIPYLGPKGPISNVYPFVRNFYWNWLFRFFLELNMVLGAHVVLWQNWIFEKKFFSPKNGENRPSLGFFECIWKFFFSICSIIKVYINCCMLGKISENFDSWDMCQNVLGQSDCRIFKSTTSLGQNHEVWFFTCSYEFIDIKNWLKNVGMGVPTLVAEIQNWLYLTKELME